MKKDSIFKRKNFWIIFGLSLLVNVVFVALEGNGVEVFFLLVLFLLWNISLLPLVVALFGVLWIAIEATATHSVLDINNVLIYILIGVSLLALFVATPLVNTLVFIMIFDKKKKIKTKLDK